jgi:tripartite-type tricarboxylate transporter receptor subunit TctC
MKFVKRIATAMALLGALLAPLQVSHAEETYPSKPIRLVLPYPPGGSYDAIARLVGSKLSAVLGQPIIVDNKPGAAGEIGTTAAAEAPADGYTLALFGNSQTVLPSINPGLAHDIKKSFDPVARVATVAEVIVVNPSVPAKSIAELVALAKAKPGQLNFGSGGAGGITHLAGELIKSSAGIDLVHIPYKGQAPAVVALISGDVQVLVLNVVSAVPQVKAGKARALAVTSSTRSPFLPDVPTAVEAGLPGYEIIEWYGLLAPKGTPPAVITKLEQAVNNVLARTDTTEALAQLGANPFPGDTPAAFAKFIDEDIAKYGAIIKRAGIQLKRN